MKNLKAFTLVELLVVVAIIALLLAILIPSLNKARELANRIACGAIVKNIATASNTYSNTYDGWFVPFCQVGWGQPAKKLTDYSTDPKVGDIRWFQNKAFRSYIHIDSYQVSSNLAHMPKEFLCPSDKISKLRTGNRFSHAYNNSDWRPWTIAYRIVGYKVSTVIKPAETLHFIDSITYDVDLNGAHYLGVWDRIKNLTPDPATWPDPRTKDYGAAHYRHSEGANVGFYDGHVEWLRKIDIFDLEGYYATPTRTGMWTANGRMISGWFMRFPDFRP
jgi:prepilin-type processing-associated H-X9-DG protein/prepilin-type N-terminal cleavage/methylation domain-containing protein